MDQVQAVDMPYTGDATETFTLTIDDVHNVLASLLASLDTISENLALVMLAKMTGVPMTAENGFPEGMSDSEDGERAYETFLKTAENIRAIHDAMESGKNVQVVAVPF